MIEVHQLALIPLEGSGVSAASAAQVAAAIQVQIQHDFLPIWHLSSSIMYLPAPASNVVPIYIVSATSNGLPGFHHTDKGLPYAVVRSGFNWPHTASHEALELIVDPTGDRMVRGTLENGTPCQYIVEVCDPCQDHPYPINGLPMSDFCSPAYYEIDPPTTAPLSFSREITRPKQILPGGTLAWVGPNHNLFQASASVDGQVTVSQYGPFQPGVMAMRERLNEFYQSYARLSARPLNSAQRTAAQRLRTAARREQQQLLGEYFADMDGKLHNKLMKEDGP